MKKLITFALALGMIACTNAQWGKRVKGNGDYVTMERSVGEYDGVALAGWFDVELVSGTEGELTLEGESNLLEHIKTEVKNGKLVIKAENGMNLRPSSWNRGIRITVPISSIDFVSLSGSGDIVGKTTIQADKFDASMSGSGDIRAFDLEAEFVEATVSGSADIKVTANQSLDARVSGSGDIQYRGNPKKVHSKASGSGDITKV
jgi:hypothetical protein